MTRLRTRATRRRTIGLGTIGPPGCFQLARPGDGRADHSVRRAIVLLSERWGAGRPDTGVTSLSRRSSRSPSRPNPGKALPPAPLHRDGEGLGVGLLLLSRLLDGSVAAADLGPGAVD